MKRYAIETAILILAATLCAVVANAMAGRERRLALVGSYGETARSAPAETNGDGWVATRDNTPAEGVDPVDGPLLADAGAASVPVTTRSETSVVTATSAPASAKQPALPATAEPAKPAAPSQPAPAPDRARASKQEILQRFPPTPDKAWVEISGADAQWLHAQGVLFLDARRTSIYEQGHIAGARSFSVWESDIDDKVGALLDDGRDQKMPIVVYCSGGACEDSHMLSNKLWGIFFENVLVYKDGFPDWQQRGGAARSGSRP